MKTALHLVVPAAILLVWVATFFGKIWGTCGFSDKVFRIDAVNGAIRATIITPAAHLGPVRTSFPEFHYETTGMNPFSARPYRGTFPNVLIGFFGQSSRIDEGTRIAELALPMWLFFFASLAPILIAWARTNRRWASPIPF